MRPSLAALLGPLLFSCGGGALPEAPPPVASATTASTCGDGILQAPEQCDDGNARDDDGCLATCFHPSTFVSGDPHVHSYGCNFQRTPEELADLAQDAGLRVAAALVWGLGYESDRPYFTGRDYPHGRAGLVLHYDLEVSRFPAAEGGHLVLLGLDSIDFSPHPFEAPHSGIPVADWARGEGPHVVVGMAHVHLWPGDGSFPGLPGGCCMPFEAPVHAVRGRLDFLAVEHPATFPLNRGAFLLWRALQNSGFRVAAAGSSDYSCLNHGFDRTPRTDVVMDETVSYSRWIDALGRGRSSVVVGRHSHISLRVDGALMGDELPARSGDTLVAAVETDLEDAADVELLVNGDVVGRFRAEAGLRSATVRLTAQKSAWVVARTPRAMTNPVYVLVDGRPIRASAGDTCYLIRAVDHLRRLPLDRAESLGAALAAYDDAQAILQQRFDEAGGGSCP